MSLSRHIVFVVGIFIIVMARYGIHKSPHLDFTTKRDAVSQWVLLREALNDDGGGVHLRFVLQVLFVR